MLESQQVAWGRSYPANFPYYQHLAPAQAGHHDVRAFPLQPARGQHQHETGVHPGTYAASVLSALPRQVIPQYSHLESALSTTATNNGGALWSESELAGVRMQHAGVSHSISSREAHQQGGNSAWSIGASLHGSRPVSAYQSSYAVARNAFSAGAPAEAYRYDSGHAPSLGIYSLRGATGSHAMTSIPPIGSAYAPMYSSDEIGALPTVQARQPIGEYLG